MVLFTRIQEVNGYLLSLFGCLKIKMEMRENKKNGYHINWQLWNKNPSH